jgi:hypothetical protein
MPEQAACECQRASALCAARDLVVDLTQPLGGVSASLSRALLHLLRM